jgi:hypothetical protein
MLSYTIQRFEKIVTINIELLDNSFTNKWKDYLLRTSKRLPDLSWCANYRPMVNYGIIKPNDHFNKLIQSFELLQEHYRIDYTHEITDLHQLINHSVNLKQSQLNCWHRHFTTNAVKFVADQTTHHLITYTTTVDDVIFKTINLLNEHVHDLEILTQHKIERRESVKDKVFYGIVSGNSKNLKDVESLWTGGNQESIIENFTFDNDYNCTVWLNDDIEGKDHFKCWYDEDDALNTDIWGNTFMTPNVLLDPNKIYAILMDNVKFKKFVLDSNKPINRYPIGNILDIEKVDWTIFKRGNKLISIVLDGIKIAPSFNNL